MRRQPVPEVLRNAPGKKGIIASPAFDPPERRRRAGYLGMEMGMNLFRGKTPDEILAAWRSAVSKAARYSPTSARYFGPDGAKWSVGTDGPR